MDVRSDNQVVAAGCSNQHVAGMQLRTDGTPTPLLFNTDFVGLPDCATAVKFVDGDTTNDAEMDTKPDENTINDMDATVFQP